MLTQVEIMEIVVENFYKDFSPFTQSCQDSNTNCLCEVVYLWNRITDKDPVSIPMAGTVLLPSFGTHGLSRALMGSWTTAIQCIPIGNDVAQLHFCFTSYYTVEVQNLTELVFSLEATAPSISFFKKNTDPFLLRVFPTHD